MALRYAHLAPGHKTLAIEAKWIAFRKKPQ
jgi:hypothetical protein